VRFGLLGTGYWADEVHAAGLEAHPEAELAGVWGRDPAKAAAVAERHGTAVEPDLDALLDRVDAVAIALPPDVQAELAVRAAERGCHLLLEKPLALTVEAADRVVAAVDRAGVQSVVFFTARFAEPTASWFDEVVAPGEWHGGTVIWLASIDAPDNPFGASPWRREHGALWDLGPHALAALIPGLGPVEEIVAVRGHGDEVHLACRHEAGRASSAILSLTATIPTEPVTRFWGSGGVVEAPRGGSAVDAYIRAITALVAAVESGASHPCDVQFGREVVRVLAAAERATRPR
jgi:predicted dehydrogenase